MRRHCVQTLLLGRLGRGVVGGDCPSSTDVMTLINGSITDPDVIRWIITADGATRLVDRLFPGEGLAIGDVGLQCVLNRTVLAV